MTQSLNNSHITYYKNNKISFSDDILPFVVFIHVILSLISIISKCVNLYDKPKTKLYYNFDPNMIIENIDDT